MIGNINLDDFITKDLLESKVPSIAGSGLGFHGQPSNTGSDTNWTPQPASRTYDWIYKFRYSINSGNLTVNGSSIDASNTVIVGFGYVVANSRKQWCEIGISLYSSSPTINGKVLFRKDYGGGTSASTNVGWKTL